MCQGLLKQTMKTNQFLDLRSVLTIISGFLKFAFQKDLTSNVAGKSSRV